MESFKSSCIWKHPLFRWWFSSKTEGKYNDYYVQIFLFYLLIFSHCFLKSNQISSGIIKFFYIFYESYFFPGQTPVPPRSWLWILDLSHDPFWAIWLAEVTKSHQHHDRIVTWSAAPSHYLNQCWNIVNSNIRNKFQWHRKTNSNIFVQENAFENVVCEISAILSRHPYVNVLFRWCQDCTSRTSPWCQASAKLGIWEMSMVSGVILGFYAIPCSSFFMTIVIIVMVIIIIIIIINIIMIIIAVLYNCHLRPDVCAGHNS